jgi:hypothetical protein
MSILSGKNPGPQDPSLLEPIEASRPRLRPFSKGRISKKIPPVPDPMNSLKKALLYEETQLPGRRVAYLL